VTFAWRDDLEAARAEAASTRRVLLVEVSKPG
jgi:hypothetical protein